MEVCAPTDDDREFMLCEEYRGFELMGMKYVPSLQLNQAKVRSQIKLLDIIHKRLRVCIVVIGFLLL